MFCEKCGSKINDGAAFCQGCGRPLSNNSPKSDTKKDTNVYLAESGVSAAYPNNLNSPKKKTSKKAIIGFAVGIVAIAVTLLLLRGGEKGADTGYVRCGAKDCSNPVVGSYRRCEKHLFTCKVCKKEIGSLSYGYCNEHYPR